MHKSWMRLSALVHKETAQLLRDRRTLLYIVGLPLIELFLFAFELGFHRHVLLRTPAAPAEIGTFGLIFHCGGFYTILIPRATHWKKVRNLLAKLAIILAD